jgi:hypothetical protein
MPCHHLKQPEQLTCHVALSHARAQLLHERECAASVLVSRNEAQQLLSTAAESNQSLREHMMVCVCWGFGVDGWVCTCACMRAFVRACACE